MMNRTGMACALLLVALLAGCGKKAPAPVTPPENPPAGQQPPPVTPTPEPEPAPVEPAFESDHFVITSPIPAALDRQLKLTGQARVETGRFIVVVEDGHNELVRQEVTVSKKAPEWADFDVTLDLSPATSPGGVLYFSVPSADGSSTQDLMIPVSFQRTE